jgi:hypothetical protein
LGPGSTCTTMSRAGSCSSCEPAGWSACPRSLPTTYATTFAEMRCPAAMSRRSEDCRASRSPGSLNLDGPLHEPRNHARQRQRL